MIIRKNKAAMLSVIDKILCDWCGRNYLLSDKDSSHTYPAGGTVTFNFGYGSKYDQYNLKEFKADICDECFERNMLSRLTKVLRV